MTPDRWQQISRLYHDALAQDAVRRAGFLQEQCAGDQGLRQEVELLLAQAGSATRFLEAPAVEMAASMLATGDGDSLLGKTVGAYEILARIGVGGMGEVYRARDTRLRRDVAIKVLPRIFAADPDRLARFDREAKLLASLNHPNIGTIHGLEEVDGVNALVLELVEGPTLADRLGQGPMRTPEALPVAKQIADALEAAHEQGIIHRDLKPANIKIRPDGTVKVLDFGLAKALTSEGPGVDVSRAPTVTAAGAATNEGVVLGTPAYMSPEQARGKPLDRRTDIWSFGCVLYEMLTGKAAFLGETHSDTIARILEHEPDWQALPSQTPTVIGRVLRRCLNKDPRERLRDIGDARVEIREAMTASSTDGLSAPPAASRSGAWRTAMSLVFGVAGLAIAVTLVWLLRPSSPPAPAPLARFAITLPSSDQLFGAFNGPQAALSPDGQTLVYVATRTSVRQLYRRALDQLEAVPIPGTEDARSPFFSPDGAWIGFESRGALKKVALSGGPPVTVWDGTETWAPRAGVTMTPSSSLAWAMAMRSCAWRPRVALQHP